MNILTRISRLFKADIHGILDNLEQPEIILQQSVRDMQLEINKAELMISGLVKQQGKFEQKKLNIKVHIEELQDQLKFCFAQKNESLAKSVIRKKLLADISMKELLRQLTNISEEKKIRIDQTEVRKEKLQAICNKLELVCEKTGFTKESLSTDLNSCITQDDVELAFLYARKCYAANSRDGKKT